MDLVLDHRSQPFPDANLRAAWRHACAVEIRGCQTGENLHRLAVKSSKVVEHCVVTVREFTAVTGIPSPTPAGDLCLHEALHLTQVPADIAGAEYASCSMPTAVLAMDGGRGGVRVVSHPSEVA